MALRPYRDEELNYFKFSSLVLNEFPNALRQTFKTMWDNIFGHRPGFQLWDDSLAVRKMFLSTEGGTTKVPTHQSYNEWDCTALFQATIFAQSFALPDSSGRRRTLNDLYVKPRGVLFGSFHPSVVSLVGNNAETFALAVDQLRLLRNTHCHLTRSEMDKITFDQRVQHAKDVFKALGATTAVIDAVGSLTESDFPTNEVYKLEQRMREEFQAYIKFLQAMSSDISELTALSTAINRRVESDTADKEDIAMLEQKLEKLIKAKNEADERDTRANEILVNVSSDINELRSNSAAIKEKMESDVPNKEDIAILEQKIDELKTAQSEHNAQGSKILEDMSSAMDELKQKLEGGTASKEDIAMLKGKIDELKVAHDVEDDQSKHPGIKLKFALIRD